MTNTRYLLFDDKALFAEAHRLAAGERASLCDFLEVLAELDSRGSYRERGFASLYEYCVSSLKLSESAAYRRIRAARAIRTMPSIIDGLRNGELTVETVALIHPHLTAPDAAALVEGARGLRVWQVHQLIADRGERLPTRDVMRFGARVPVRMSADESQPGSLFEPGASARLDGHADDERSDSAGAIDSRSRMPAGDAAQAASESAFNANRLPRAEARLVRVAFTAGEEFFRLLSRARALTRHKHPDGRLAGVLTDALKALIARKDPLFRVPDEPRRARGGRDPGR
jgi:hypothetical protein